MAKIQKVIDDYPGLKRDVLTYLKERIKEVLTGAGATIVVRIFGPDMAVLRDKAQEVYGAIKGVDGVAVSATSSDATIASTYASASGRKNEPASPSRKNTGRNTRITIRLA